MQRKYNAGSKEVDYLVCSEDFARQYTGKTINLNDPKKVCEIFEEIEQINHKHAVVTLGEKGLLYRRDGKITLMPAFKVKAVDTNGAGTFFMVHLHMRSSSNWIFMMY